MDKKVKSSEQPTRVKVIYAAVIAVLIVTAIVVGVVSAANRKDGGTNPDGNNPPANDGNEVGDGNENEGESDGEGEGNKQPAKLSFVSPAVGSIAKSHSLEIPAFSDTLGEWRMHTGIDISCDEGAEVFAVADGTVTDVTSDPLLGKTVEITHTSGIVSRYSNLAAEVAVKEGDAVKSGTKIGSVGDTSLSELADEPHLHFEVTVNGTTVNPLDYISEDSKRASLGISEV